MSTNVTVVTGGVRVATIAAGPAGKPGATILSGTGTPDNADGADGDFYVDRTTGALKFFGPKTAGAWGAGAAISGTNGTDGDDGTDGETIFTTSGAPDDSAGNDGDLAFDRTALVIYGPKVGGSWPAGAQLTSGPTPQIRITADVADYTVRQADAPGGRDVVYLCEGATRLHVLAHADEAYIAGCEFGVLDLGGLQPSFVFDSQDADVVFQNGPRTSGAGSPMVCTVLDVPDAYVVSGDTTP